MVGERRVLVHQIFAIPNVSIPKDVQWGDVTHQELAQKKLDLLQKVNSLALSQTVKLKSCGQQFKINSHFAIPKSLEALLSDEPRVHLEFNWYDCESLGMGSSEFEDESGQDCVLFSLGEWEFSIQRDFVSAKNHHQVVLISYSKIADGFQNALRCYIPRLLLRMNFLVVHCSAVALNDQQAIAFMGPSGVGKSTILSRAPNLVALHDDMNILRIGMDHKVYIKGAELGSILVPDLPKISKEYQLIEIYQLRQSQKNEIFELKPADRFTLLLSNFANYFWETLTSGEVDQLTKAAQDITNSVPISEFRNNADVEVWEMLKVRHGLS